jgi:hypothetical protein
VTVRHLSEPTGEPWLTLAGLTKRLLLLGRTTRLVHARVRTSEGEVIYVGEGESLTWLARLHGGQVADSRAVDWPGLQRMVIERTSLLYVEVNRLLRPLLPPGAFFTLPWIGFSADLVAPPKHDTRKMVESTYGRKVRQQGFGFRRIFGETAARAFYRDFYLPYLRWRFGDEAHPRGQDEIVAVVKDGFILQVLDKDWTVAEAACRVSGSTLTLVALGLAADFASLLRRGAASALYYEMFRWARAHGIQRVKLLRSRPHVRDGVSLHKRRFGAEPVLDPWPHTTLAVYPYPIPSAALSSPACGLLVQDHCGKLVTLAECLQRRGKQTIRESPAA